MVGLSIPVRRPQSDKAPSTRVVLNTDSHMVFNALQEGKAKAVYVSWREQVKNILVEQIR